MSEVTIPMVCENAPGSGLGYGWATPTEIVHVLEQHVTALEEASHGFIHRVELAIENEITKIEDEVKKIVKPKPKPVSATADVAEALEASDVLKTGK